MLLRADQKTNRALVLSSSRYFSSNDDESEEGMSSRKKFLSLPVHSSILQYIQTVGVGIPKRKSRARRVKERRADVMDEQQEKEFFDKDRRRRRITTNQTNVPASINQEQPPLPFGVPITNGDGSTIRKKPVKVVRRVGSLSEKFPVNRSIPEIALAGRSNVGKSSLLNALLYGNPSFARSDRGGRRQSRLKAPKGVKAVISPTPGETKQISFYQLSPPKELVEENLVQNLWLVDLPGYGFAYDGKAEEWQECTRQYLLQRGKMLKRVLLLLDARHGMKNADIDFLTSLESSLHTTTTQQRKPQLPPLQIVLTKCDLVPQADLARRVVQVERQLSDCLRRQPSNLPVLLASVKQEQRGVLELQKELSALVPSETNKYSKTKKY